MKGLDDNVQDIVDRNNGHDILDSQLCNYVTRSALIQIEQVIAFDSCILQPASYPRKALAFVL